MPAGDLVVADWQMEYGGVLFGDTTSYSIARIEGLLDTPELRSADRQRLRRHGLIPGDDFLNGRTITVALEVFGDSDATFATAVASLQGALIPCEDEAALYFQVPGVAGGEKRLLYCRPRKLSLPVDLDFFYRLPIAMVQFFATDPLIYDGTEDSEVSTLPTAGGGLEFPATAPFTFGAVSTGGTINAVNSGTFHTSPTFRIDGPVTNPRIENVTTGQTLSFTGTVADGDYLEVDVDARTVLLNGTASRYSWIDADAEWWDLPPGTSEVTFRASTTTAATLTMTWRSAWV
jgi:hypothetical protein